MMTYIHIPNRAGREVEVRLIREARKASLSRRQRTSTLSKTVVCDSQNTTLPWLVMDALRRF